MNSSIAEESPNGKFVHTVLFWLKNPDSKKDREAFEKSLTKFVNTSVFIKTKHLGVPASTDRPVIDKTYSYCLMVTFDSREMHDKYQEEVAHKVFISESEHLWKKVLIYDSENILK
ncbi:Stress responsive alpha-beta barrel domain-containing protein [Pseudopedobacter saltans DSM 12145]|uniref:Stress responsive alpha-beta barrel domain-containing protein n=1 Tax=Pseudopedobacter saltans (strain ATCC 51119 / DSM 12145 / JCM 21818 / CCUG 39354 / LMG 10337 / NBRC 100064 / NCIMB 13643) TaxID=762903 RepID=F0S5H8_PSESL|nr:Dabb family protein [Pseudopedobacter saltans]ADY53142.1 Stress responsive alpha-beta barrel domain-containing protein [Pseudopedobacter saltans DSM 12145]